MRSKKVSKKFKKLLQIIKQCVIIYELYAVMAELADAHGSGPCARKGMEVQVLLAAPNLQAIG